MNGKARPYQYYIEYLHPERGWVTAHYATRLEGARTYARTARDNWRRPTRVCEVEGKRVVAGYLA